MLPCPCCCRPTTQWQVNEQENVCSTVPRTLAANAVSKQHESGNPIAAIIAQAGTPAAKCLNICCSHTTFAYLMSTAQLPSVAHYLELEDNSLRRKQMSVNNAANPVRVSGKGRHNILQRAITANGSPAAHTDSVAAPRWRLLSRDTEKRTGDFLLHAGRWPALATDRSSCSSTEVPTKTETCMCMRHTHDERITEMAHLQLFCDLLSVLQDRAAAH